MRHPTHERSHRARILAAFPLALLLSVACSQTPEAGQLPIDASCSDYLDEATPGATQFLVRNESPDWIYLIPESCRSSIDLSISRDGEDLDLMTGDCDSSCGELQQGGPFECALACPAPFAIAIEPGGAYPLAWSGLYAAERSMPAACYGDGDARSCLQRTAAEAGTFGASVDIATAIECDGDCTCEPNADGYCTLDNLGALPTGPTTLEATFDFPASDAIELVWRQEASIDCPADIPGQDEPCAAAGVGVCTYEATDPCGHALDPEASCDGSTWAVIFNQPFCDLECPATAPTASAPCAPAADGAYCRYGEAATCEVFACDDATDTWSTSPCE